MTDEKELSYGAKLCPECQTNEVVWASKCKACYQRTYQKAYRQSAKGKAAYRRATKRWEAKNNRAAYMKAYRQAKAQSQTIRIEVHVYIHHEPAGNDLLLTQDQLRLDNASQR